MVGGDERAGLVDRRFRAGEPAIAQAGGAVDGRRRVTADPHLERLGGHGGDLRAVDVLARAETANDVERVLEAGDASVDVDVHGRELLGAAADGALHDEAPGRDGRQRADLLGDEHRVPQREQVERAGRPFVPLGQQPAEHRGVLVVGDGHAVVVADEERVEPCVACGPRPLDHPPRSGAPIVDHVAGQRVDDARARAVAELGAGRQSLHGLHALDRHAPDRDRFVRSHEQVQVDAVAAPRAGTVELPRLESRSRAGYALAVGAHPFAYDSQALDLLGRQRPVPARADVEQQVPAAPGHLAQRVDELTRRLVVRVRGVVAPALVHRHARLPRPAGWSRGNELLGRLVVAEPRQTVVDEDVGLQRVDELDQLAPAPLRRRPLPSAVEPQHVDAAVVGEELGDLPGQVFEVAAPPLGPGHGWRVAEAVGLVRLGERGVVRRAPVGQREVEADAQTLGAHGVDELAHDVAPERRVLDRELGELGVEHRVARVVLGGEHRVGGTGVARGAGESGGVPCGGGERRRRRVVLLDRHRLAEGQREGAADERPRDLETLLTGVVPVHEEPEARAREPIGCGPLAQLRSRVPARAPVCSPSAMNTSPFTMVAS